MFQQAHPSCPLLCRSKYNETTVNRPEHNFRFSPQTANATLQNHLKKFHAEEYLQLSSEGKWSNQLPNMRQDGATEASIGQQAMQDNHPRPAFTRKTFLTHIINFIVADDQVCSNMLKAYMTLTDCFLHSLSTSLNVKNFVISFFSFVWTYKTRISHIAQRFVRPLSRHGRRGSKNLSKSLRYVPSYKM